ncbi:MAG: hypothetical protein JWM85_684 [Acidimicrobiaceae bacterium]|nr:hypothetical protein [Acidimicrobiaceae bacterium]
MQLHLAVIYWPNSVDVLELAEKTGPYCRLVWVLAGDEELGPNERLLGRLGDVIDIRGHSFETALAQLSGSEIDGVLGFTDETLRLAARVGGLLGLRSNSVPTVEAVTDKYLQRRALREHGIPTPPFLLVPAGTDAQALRKLVAGFPYPAILKPSVGAASRDTCWVAGPDAVLDAVFASSGHERFLLEGYLLGRREGEKSALGEFLSVETFVERGRPEVLGVTGKFSLAPPFRERGHILPPPVDEADAASAAALAVDAAKALGVQWGALHVEVKLCRDGPKLIEVNGRLGGGRIPELYAVAYACDFIALACRLVLPSPPLLATARRMPLASSSLTETVYHYRYNMQAPTHASRLLALKGAERIRQLPGVQDVMVNRSVGDRLDWHEGTDAYVLTVRGTTSREALESVPDLIDLAAEARYETAQVPAARPGSDGSRRVSPL